MAGISVGKSRRRAVSWARREQKGAGQKVELQAVFVEPGLASLLPSVAVPGGGEEVGGRPGPRLLATEQSNCFKMFSPACGARLVNVMCVCLRNNQTK